MKCYFAAVFPTETQLFLIGSVFNKLMLLFVCTHKLKTTITVMRERERERGKARDIGKEGEINAFLERIKINSFGYQLLCNNCLSVYCSL